MAKAVNQYNLNKQIEDFIREKDSKNENYSADEISFIQQYEGSGGQGSKGASGEGVLYEFFTPDYVVQLMWELAYKHGFDKEGSVLEPSIATGRIIAPALDLIIKSFTLFFICLLPSFSILLEKDLSKTTFATLTVFS